MNKHDIALIFGVAGEGSIHGESGKLIKSQLSEIVKSLNADRNLARLRFSVDTQASTQLITQSLRNITENLGKGGTPLKLRVSEIDASAAVADFKKQLESMLQSLRIDTGFNVTVGDRGATSAVREISRGAREAATSLTEVNARLKEISITGRALAAEYTKVWQTLDNLSASDSLEVSEESIYRARTLSELFVEMDTAAKNLQANRATASQEEIQAVNELQNRFKEVLAVQREYISASREDKSSGIKEQFATLQQVEALYRQIDDYLNSNTAAATTEQYKALAEKRDILGDVAVAASQVGNKFTTLGSVDLSRTRSEFAGVRAELREAGNEGRTLGDAMAGAYRKFGGWMFITRSLMGVNRQLRQMVRYVVEIDTGMTELRKVTEETEAVYARFLEDASRRARALGATMSDTIMATADFARLGYNIVDASMLADAALVYKNVGDGIRDVNRASSSIISTMKAFGIEAQDAMRIVDRFNKVGNNFAISSAGIGEALIRSASAMAAANNTIDETIGLIVAANNVIQDPQVVGTALRTLSLRLRNTAGGLEELGEDADGAAESITRLQTQLLNLTGGRLDIMYDNETFKSTFQIILELSEIWDSLSDKAQADVTRLVAGVRQANILGALMTNMAEGVDAATASLNSYGSAMAELEVYLNSIEGRLSVFTAAFQGMSADFINTEFVKGVVDFGTAILDLIRHLGGLQNIVLLAVGAFALLKPKLIAAPFKALGNAIKTFGANVAGATKAYGMFTASIVKGNAVKHSAALAITVLTKALAPLLLGFTVLKMIVDAVVRSNIENDRAAMRQAEAAREQANALSVLRMEFDRLAGIANRTTEEEERFRDVQEQIIPLLGERTRVLRGLTQGTEEYNAELQRLMQIELADSLGRMAAGIEGARNELERSVNLVFRGTRDSIPLFLSPEIGADLSRQIQAIMEDFTGRVHSAGAVSMPAVLQPRDADEQLEFYARLRESLGLLNEEAARLAEVYDHADGAAAGLAITQSALANDMRSVSDNMSEQVTGLLEMMVEYEAARARWAAGGSYPETPEGLEAFIQGVTEAVGVSEHFNETIKEMIHEIPSFSLAWARVFGTEYIESAEEAANRVSWLMQNLQDEIHAWNDALTESERNWRMSRIDGILRNLHAEAEKGTITWEQYEEALRNVSAGTSSAVNATDELKSQLRELQSAYDVVARAIEEYNETQTVSLDTVLRLLDIGAEYLRYLFDENGNLVLNEEAFRNLAIAKLEDLRASRQLAMHSLIEELRETGQTVEELADAWVRAAAAKRIYAQDIDIGDYASLPQVQAYLNEIRLIEQSIAGLRSGASRLGTASRPAAESAERQAEPHEVQISATRILEAQLQKVNELLRQNESLFNFTSARDVQADLLRERIKLLEQQQALLHQVNNANRAEIASNISRLAEFGVNVRFDPDRNFLKFEQTAEEIQHIFNNIRVGDVESTNEVKRELEQMLDSMISLNEANDRNGSQWLEIRNIIRQTQSEIVAVYRQAYEDGIKVYADRIADLRFELEKLENADFHDRFVLNNKILVEQTNIIDANRAELARLVQLYHDGLIASEDFRIESENLHREWQDGVLTARQYERAVSDIVAAQRQAQWDEAIGKLNQIQSVYRTLIDAAQEFADSGFITVDTFQRIINLGTEYLAYLIDENGQLVINEETIKRVIAAKTEQAAVETALNYIQSLRTALNDDDTESLNRLLFATQAAAKSTWDLVYAQLAMLDLDEKQHRAALERINTLRSLAETAITSIGRATGAIREAAEEAARQAEQAAREAERTLMEALRAQENALNDLLRFVMDMIRWETRQRIDGLREQVRQYRDIVNLQKESLRLARDKDNHDRAVANSVQEIARLQARIEQLALDDSREANATRRGVEEELARLQERLADTQARHAYDTQVATLDRMADAFADQKEEEVRVLEQTVSSQEKVYRLAIERISNHWDTLFQDLIHWNYTAGNSLESELVAAWDSASAAVQRYGSFLDAILQTQNQIAMLNASMTQSGSSWASGASGNNGTPDTPPPASNPNVVGNTGQFDTSGAETRRFISDLIRQMRVNGQRWFNASIQTPPDQSTMSSMSDANVAISRELSRLLGRMVIRNDATGVWYLDRIGGARLYDEYDRGRLLPKFHTGGIAGGLPTPKDNEILALLEKGEAILDEQKKEALYKLVDFATVLSERLGTAIDIGKLGTMPATRSDVVPSVSSLPEKVNAAGDLVFCPEVSVSINHNGSMTNEDASRYGEAAAESALSRLNDAFHQRGIGGIGSAILKQK